MPMQMVFTSNAATSYIRAPRIPNVTQSIQQHSNQYGNNFLGIEYLRKSKPCGACGRTK